MENKFSQIQEQEQQLVQQQRLTAQQILQVRMLEMPLAQIEQAVKAELCDNPALEADSPDDGYGENVEGYDDPRSDYDDVSESSDGDAYDGMDDYDDSNRIEEEQERSDREDALDAALDSMGSDDRDGQYDSDYRSMGVSVTPDADQEEQVFGESQSFYDNLMQQVADEDLDDRQLQIITYLIGSLEGDGLLHKSLLDISDELAIYHSLDCSEKEIESVLEILQSFDPAGVGARNLQECLVLQIKRREPSEMHRRMALVIVRYFDIFTKKHWDKLAHHLQLTPEQTKRVIDEIRKLNPRPGSSLGETMGRNTQQVTPDFIVDTAYDGTVTFQLNQGDVPMLRVSSDFEQQYQGFQKNRESMNRMQKEALLYTKEKLDRARGYIEAVQKRRTTMMKTMRAIIDIQRKFFQDGDESDLVPMTLKDVADRIGMDISTVSRVCNAKYADTRWGTFRLRHFFSDSYTVSGTSEELSTRKIKIALRDLIDAEDKKHPLSDQALAEEMKKLGYPIARRTVTKYREQLNLPIARLRK